MAIKRFLLLMAALFLWAVVPAFAELCPKCKDKAYTADIGVCKECGGTATSGAFALCPACSTKLHQCEHCREALSKSATYHTESPVAPVVAGLCPKCTDRSYTKDIGKCKECGGITFSGEFQLCLECSGKLRQCEHCRAALAAATPAVAIDLTRDGVYTSDPWEYRYSISNRGSRSEGYHGRLLFEENPPPEPGAVNDYYETPWGRMYWVGQPFVAFGAHGWMPKPLVRAKIGRLLNPPASAAPGEAKAEAKSGTE
jgi:hypothetical protein